MHTTQILRRIEINVKGALSYPQPRIGGGATTHVTVAQPSPVVAFCRLKPALPEPHRVRDRDHVRYVATHHRCGDRRRGTGVWRYVLRRPIAATTAFPFGLALAPRFGVRLARANGVGALGLRCGA